MVVTQGPPAPWREWRTQGLTAWEHETGRKLWQVVAESRVGFRSKACSCDSPRVGSSQPGDWKGLQQLSGGSPQGEASGHLPWSPSWGP